MKKSIRHKMNAETRRYHRKQFITRTVISVLRALFLIGICFTVIYPMLSHVFASFMPARDFYNSNIKYLPSSLVLDNYKKAWELLNYGSTVLNSVVLCLLSSVSQIIVCTMVGYGFARFQFRGKNILFMLLILGLVVPPDLLLIQRMFQFKFFDLFGIFKLTRGVPLDLLNTVWPFVMLGLTCSGLKNGLYVFIMRQYFMGLPKEIEEAAYVDGAGPIKTYVRVILPGAVTNIVTIFLFSVVWQWNDTVYTPVFYTEKNVITTMIKMLPTGTISMSSVNSLTTNAGIVLIVLPMLILYAFLQNYFVKGVERSGLVG
mgnify:CR=1 FL=1